MGKFFESDIVKEQLDCNQSTSTRDLRKHHEFSYYVS
ncbi:MAG: hypothetical protein CM15mL4_1550 [uncultured marine virus]|nr:MAG: hypothetical protein CM15mL4_1550 [uncultured marine virus]